jgi:hypothetical protein
MTEFEPTRKPSKWHHTPLTIGVLGGMALGWRSTEGDFCHGKSNRQ